ncbi:EpsG family protein [Vibrio fluvialis]|nr:EpsG family protein [Vibrio fluvialis]MBY8052211.1 EpsG family protein [Vibrio fluvialis]
MANYDKNLNPDILNYMGDYVNSNWTYDVGYEIFSNSIKFGLGFNFEQYWVAQLIVQMILLIILYNRLPIFLLAYPNLLFLSETLFGTQIRYAIGIELLLIGLLLCGRNSKVLLSIISMMFHYGISLIIAVKLYKEYFYTYNDRFGKRLLIQLTLFMLGALLFSFSIDFIANATRYSYYVGSRYFESKSLSSILYVLIFFIFVSYYFFYVKVNCHVIEFSFYILLLILCTSSFAVVSGRVQIFFFMIEPVLIYSIFKLRRKNDYVFSSFLYFFSMSKFIGFYI